MFRYVSDAMGGFVEKGDLTKFSYELHISGLKTELNSNVIPIGRIQKGIYYHRALLFKVNFYSSVFAMLTFFMPLLHFYTPENVRKPEVY